MKRHATVGLVAVFALLCGCANTTIRRDASGFLYSSDKDINIEGLEFELIRADGTKEIVKIKRGGGQASAVNAGWQGVIGGLVERIPIVQAPPASIVPDLREGDGLVNR